ncbi:MAG: hypothetical protein Q9227_008817 [Pyrenula ochraceoflavens]
MLLTIFSLGPVLLGGLSVLAVAVYWLLSPPYHPKGIPSIPFWVVLLPFFYDVDQEETYRKYIQRPLEKYGIVKIFFSGHWNLLVQDSKYVAEIFKNEDVYQKTGNQKKIPHSVLAEFLGDNVISARDANWRLYQSIVKPALQAKFDIEPIMANAKDLCMLLLAAKMSGIITAKQFRDNLNVAFVAGQENPQLALISTLYLLGKHPDVQSRLRAEVQTSGIVEPSPEHLQDLCYLNSVIYESLRLFPPISQLINRRAAEPTFLGGEILIPEGTFVGYNSYSTNRDRKIWGKDADLFQPDRWGQRNEDILKQYRKAKARAEFISFHGGKRACLGEKFAILEMRATLFILVRNFQWTLDPDWLDRKTPAGPLYPRGLRLIFSSAPEQHEVAI